MQKIMISDDALYINGNIINWNEIRGVREMSSALVSQFGTRFPRAELFIGGGKVFVIQNTFVLEGTALHEFEDKHKRKHPEFFTLMDIIPKRANELRPDVTAWLEWRLVLPVIIVELCLGIFLLFSKKSFEEIVMIIIIGGILSVPIGWVWERKARRKAWR